MAGAAAVVTLIVMVHALLPTVTALAWASPLAAAGQALPSITALADHLLLLLLHEEQLAVYTRWWQRILLLGAILCHA
jgi:hypothetical protein